MMLEQLFLVKFENFSPTIFLQKFRQGNFSTKELLIL